MPREQEKLLNVGNVQKLENDMLSQRRLVLDHLLKYGSISSWTAIQEYHITRLSEYIRQLRSENKNIVSTWKEKEGKRWVEYSLILEN